MYQKGAVLYEQRKFAEAAAMFDAEVRINPNDPNVHLALGHCLSLLGKSAEANAHFAEYNRLAGKK